MRKAVKWLALVLCVSVIATCFAGCATTVEDVDGIWAFYDGEGELKESLEISGNTVVYKYYFTVLGSKENTKNSYTLVELEDGLWAASFKYGMPVYMYRLERVGDTLNMFDSDGDLHQYFEKVYEIN